MGSEQPSDPSRTGGQFVRDRRLACGLSPEALADAVGASRGTIDRWEKDVTLPQKGRRGRLALALNISGAELLHGLGLVQSAAATNVVELRPAQEGSGHPATPDEKDQYTEDQRRLLDTIMEALGTDRSRDATWLAATAATARTLRLAWDPLPFTVGSCSAGSGPETSEVSP